MTEELILKKAKIVTRDGIIEGSLIVEGEKIKEIVSGDVNGETGKVIDLGGKHVMAGLVDGHVHFNEPGRTHWEGYETGSRAAAAGGVTTVLEMPLNATPPTITRELLKEKRDTVKDKSVIDFGNWGGLVDNNVEHIEGMHEDGVVAFKAFLSNSGVDFERINDDRLYAGLKLSKQLGTVMGLHAENEFVTTLLSQQLKDAGRTDRAAWYESRPPETELEAIQRASYWAGVTGGNLHVVHITIGDGIRHLDEAKGEGVHVTTETCPHYLYFDHQDFEEIGPGAKCAPPIRSRETVEDLWDCVLNGQVDVINSDHSPCEWKDKEQGMDNIWKAWGGITGIQTQLSVLLSEGVNKRGLLLEDLSRMVSENPAKIYGLYPRKGVIAPGSDADLVVVDLDEEWTFTTDQMFSRNQHSAYGGRTFKGKVLQTYVRGKLVYDNGKIVADKGYGKMLRREMPYRFN